MQSRVMSQNPFFSIVIPVFNRIDSLKKSILSVLDQTFTDFEIWVVDDGSKEKVALAIRELVDEIGDVRIFLISYKNNMNGAVARNKGINAAKGTFIAFLDSDDEWKPEKLNQVYDVIQLNRDLKFLYHQYCNIENNKQLSPFPRVSIKANQSISEYSFCTNKGGGIQSSCIIVEASLAKQVLFEESLRGHQDWDFALRFGAVCKEVYFIPKVLTFRHIADGNVGMVSRGLDYSFSYDFVRAYQQYFTIKALAAFSTFVLENKRQLSLPKPKLNIYQILGYLYYPVENYKIFKRLVSLKARCKKLSNYCLINNISNIALVGFNPYTQVFLGLYGDSFKSVTLIDKCKQASTKYGTVQAASFIDDSHWTQIELLVAMTDKHYESMKRDLATYTAKADSLYAF
jgi:glycosyltransferase involved in cell wall biosynthesis